MSDMSEFSLSTLLGLHKESIMIGSEELRTKEQVDGFLKKHNHCPSCKSTDIDSTGDVALVEHGMNIMLMCNRCEEHWWHHMPTILLSEE